MSPLAFTFITFAASIVAGVCGSILGLGGGIVVIPVLTLLLGVDIRFAIGASIVSVIATSSGAAAAYVREHMTNLRVAMLLELGTTSGALTGAFLGGLIAGRWLFLIFSVVMGYSALAMFQKRHSDPSVPVPPDPIADRLKLHGEYFDEQAGEVVRYRVTHTPLGLALMYVAGMVSGLLGIGSGSLKVPAMDLAMHLPIKVSSTTSNFMIGVTGAASAGVYFARGDINPFIAGPVAAGVLIGATLGSRLLGRLKSSWVRVAFVVVLLWVCLQMAYKGIVG
ncbi:MAG TPA: sulfite exporter TauE/SafE family protein [Phycisphaerae bacterium]|nr:sulfite exporter TauE/SafE family protein [Phycisphaerae bacterium]